MGRIRQIGPFERVGGPWEVTVNEHRDSVDLSTGQAAKIESPIVEHKLDDDELHADGKPYRYAVYAYRMIAINRWGQASGPSATQFTFPPAVQGVFAKEEGDTATRLRWQAYPGARFHVYRHNGRYDKDAIVRLTDEPIRESEYLDKTAGRDTRRYEIVAVDSLDQEGAPSQPVWSRREWRRFYVPYIGEWHQ